MRSFSYLIGGHFWACGKIFLPWVGFCESLRSVCSSCSYKIVAERILKILVFRALQKKTELYTVFRTPVGLTETGSITREILSGSATIRITKRRKLIKTKSWPEIVLYSDNQIKILRKLF